MARLRRRKVALGLLVFVVSTLGAVAAYAWQQGWLSREFLAASRPCGEMSPTVAVTDSTEPQLLSAVSAAASPTAMAFTNDRGRAFVAEREGTIRVLRGRRLSSRPVVDLRDRVGLGDDQGLLGLVLDPAGTTLVAWFQDVESVGHLVAWPVRNGAPVAGEERSLLEVAFDTVHHNGGGLAWGPDGQIYLGVGDGGRTGDPDGYAQDPDALKGKVLRIDPQDGGHEVVALGLRNPYGVTFDDVTGDLWVADVGHECMEEVDRVPAGVTGVNFGWNRFEGTRDFLGGDATGFEAPVYAYPHAGEACAVIGGTVPRGVRSPESLRGRYVFGDFCSGRLAALHRTGDGARVMDLGVDVGGGLLGVTSGPDGEVYVLSIGHGIQRLT